ncbi:MAG TPA: ABC transporter ATP-binding protein [Holophagaceae bacterium]
MIEVKGLGKCFGDRWPLREASFAIQSGDFVGLLGRNGAGKTTLLRLLTGQFRPSEGQASIEGLDVSSRPLALRRLAGVMPEEDALLDDLTGTQYLHFAGQMHGLLQAELGGRIRELQDSLEVDFHEPKIIRDYSYGMKKKLAFASALLHGPRLLFLDEPFEGLDPAVTQTLLSLLKRLHAGGCTVIMASHLLGLAEQLCTRFLLIEEGRILLDEPAEGLIQAEGDLRALFLQHIGARNTEALSWM